ncbi:MAG: hypothetical protein JJU46_00760 [Balneolaceae bacterium]|nr:hypothetical protein [Balneolaceae bacterium]MCH8548919.1 6-bladed beta-propeller [Balneolaceae bacterium]
MNKQRKRVINGALCWIFCLTSASVLISCTHEPPASIPDDVKALPNLTIIESDSDGVPELNLVQDLTINAGDYSDIRSLWNVTADDAGNIFWLDNRAHQIHRFGSDGERLSSLGNEGRGPGEFTFLSRIAVSGDRLFALDFVSQTVSKFRISEGTFEGSMALNRERSGERQRVRYNNILADSDSALILFSDMQERFEPDSLRLSRYSSDGLVMSFEFLSLQQSGLLRGRSGSSTFSTGAVFTPSSHVAQKPDGSFIHSYADRALFTIYDAEGEYREAIFLNLDPHPLTRDQIDQAVESSNPMIDLDRAVRNADELPDKWPVWDQFLTDDIGRVWMEVWTDPPAEKEWWILSKEEGMISRVRLEPDVGIRMVKNGFIYATTLSGDFPEIRRYRIEEPG